MSYSYSGTFRTRASATKHIEGDVYVPAGVKALVKDGLASLGEDTDERFIVVSASGHSSHDIKVNTYHLTPVRPASS